MQRPSFALAVLFGALASGLLVANVAPCQVIVVFHDVRVVENTSQDRAADFAKGPTQPEYAPADQPAVSAPPAVTVELPPPSDASPADFPPASATLRDTAPSPVTLTPAADAVESAPTISDISAETGVTAEAGSVVPTAPAASAVSAPIYADTAPLPQWLGTGDADPLDAMPPVESAPAASSNVEVEVAAPSASEAAQSVPAEQAQDVERADLLENTAKKVGEAAALGVAPDASKPIPTDATTTPEERPASKEGALVEPELAVETTPAMSLEPLRDAARGVAVTLDKTATWVQATANGLRTWADRDANGQAR